MLGGGNSLIGNWVAYTPKAEAAQQTVNLNGTPIHNNNNAADNFILTADEMVCTPYPVDPFDHAYQQDIANDGNVALPRNQQGDMEIPQAAPAVNDYEQLRGEFLVFEDDDKHDQEHLGDMPVDNHGDFGSSRAQNKRGRDINEDEEVEESRAKRLRRR